MDYPEYYKVPELDLATTRQTLAKDYAEYFRRGYAANPESEESLQYENSFMPHMQEYLYAEQLNPDNSVDMIKGRILNAYNQANPHKEPVTTLSKAVDSYGLNFRILHSLKSIDMINLLFATAYAGMSRHTKAGLKLYEGARRIITHEMTNDWMRHDIEAEVEEKDEARNFDRLIRSSYASYAFAKLEGLKALKLQDEAPVVSIDTVLPLTSQPRFIFTDLPSLEDDLRIAAGVDALHSYEEIDEPIQNITIGELQQRLTNISVLESDLRERFGQDITIQYKELSIKLDKSTRDLYEPLERQTSHQSETEPHEGSSDFSGYTFIEITKSTGEQYVIADSPDDSNACYVVRSDIVAEMSVLFGTTLRWQDILKYPKETARQLGATRFYHTATSDTFSKAVNHIERPIDMTLKGVGTTWLLPNNPTFDINMNPTPANRLPLVLREAVAEKSEEVKVLLLRWLELEDIPSHDVRQRLARRALEQPSQGEVSELERLKAESLQKDIEIERLTAENTKFRAMLKIAIGE